MLKSITTISKVNSSQRQLFLASLLCDGLEDNNLNQIITLLQVKEADPNVILPTHGSSPFHLVIGNECEAFAEEVTKWFLLYGGNSNVKSTDGTTPVHVAAAWGRVKILKLLLFNGGNPLCLDDDGKSPFHYAFEGSYYDVITVLSKYCGNHQCDNSYRDDKKKDEQKYECKSPRKLSKILINKDNIIGKDVAPSNIDYMKRIEPTLLESISKKNNVFFTHNDESSSDKSIHHLSINRSNVTLRRHQIKENYNHNIDLGKNMEKYHTKSEKLRELRELREGSVSKKKKNITSNIDSNNTNNYNKIAISNNKSPSTSTFFDTSIISKSPNFNIVYPRTRKIIEDKTASIIENLDYFVDNDNSSHYDDLKKLKYLCSIDRGENIVDLHATLKNQESPPSSTPSFLLSRYYDDSQQDEKSQMLINISNIFNASEQTPTVSISWDYKTDNDSFETAIDENDDPAAAAAAAAAAYDDSISSFRYPIETSFFSVDEEYNYVDKEKNIAFLERRLRVPIIRKTDVMNMAKCKDTTTATPTIWIKKFEELLLREPHQNESPFSTNLDEFSTDNHTLRNRLIALGESPGPITHTTHNVYLKRLTKLERNIKEKDVELRVNQVQQNKIELKNPQYLPQSLLLLSSSDLITNIQFYRDLEYRAFQEYHRPNLTKKYRGGIAKVSFNYLLLDSRLTKDLPRTGCSLSLDDRWGQFLDAIFYVGKGKAARPAAHLYDAFDIWIGKNNVRKPSEKIQRILEIWNDGKGVVCLHVFINTMQEEAFSREAAMIDVLGTNHLSNCNRGNYYGVMSTMSNKEKKLLGKFLLYKAMEIFMHEGERQLFPKNIE